MTSNTHTPAPAPRLTPRERAALTAAAMGYIQQTAARHFHISYRVLGRYLGQAATRLGAANTTHAVTLALLGGHLDPIQIRTRILPAWPTDIDPEERLASLRARLEQARTERTADADERRAQFAELRAARVPLKEASRRLGVSRRTAQRYQQRLERETAAREGANAAAP